jgi:hypothetical protein
VLYYRHGVFILSDVYLALDKSSIQDEYYLILGDHTIVYKIETVQYTAQLTVVVSRGSPLLRSADGFWTEFLYRNPYLVFKDDKRCCQQDIY